MLLWERCLGHDHPVLTVTLGYKIRIVSPSEVLSVTDICRDVLVMEACK